MTDKKTPALVLKNLTKTYGRSRGISGINLEVMQGEIFGFLGPNGAGKSTTINTILDLLHADTGSAHVLGMDSHKKSVEIRKRIGYLSGDMTTDPSLTGKQYLEFARRLHGSVDTSYVSDLVDRLHAEVNKKIKALSRGNRQKIGLVAALMHDPDLLILDEPTSGLDPLIQSEFNHIIHERQVRGKTTFMSSHVLSEVQEVCDRVGFIRDGKLIRVSRLDELLRDAPRKVSVSYKGAAPDSLLKGLKGIEELHVLGKRREFTFRGNYNELLHVISTKPLHDLQILEPQLDELFIQYYQHKEHDNV